MSSSDNDARVQEQLAEKMRAMQELEREVAELKSKLKKKDSKVTEEPRAGTETSEANSEVITNGIDGGVLQKAPTTIPPSELFPALDSTAPPASSPPSNDRAPTIGDPSASEISPPAQMQRLSSFGRLSMDSLPPHCHLNKHDIQLQGLVGRGSFGVVWRALYQTRTQVAVKLFLYEDVASEIIMLAHIPPHPHVLNFLGVIFEVDDPYKEPQVALVTKYMAGGSLYDLLVHAKSPQFDAEGTVRHSALRLVKLASEAAAGVAHLHAHGIIHRDLACRNLLVDEGASSVAVADFGFARLRAKTELGGYSASKCGPVRWEAPESLRLKQYSEATDVFMLGVTLWEMIAGKVPWQALPTAAAAYAVLSGERLALPCFTDPVFGALVLRCWHDDPRKRLTLRQLRDTLEGRAHELAEDQRSAADEEAAVFNLVGGAILQKVVLVQSNERQHHLSSPLEFNTSKGSSDGSVSGGGGQFGENLVLRLDRRRVFVSEDLRRLRWTHATGGDRGSNSNSSSSNSNGTTGSSSVGIAAAGAAVASASDKMGDAVASAVFAVESRFEAVGKRRQTHAAAARAAANAANAKSNRADMDTTTSSKSATERSWSKSQNRGVLKGNGSDGISQNYSSEVSSNAEAPAIRKAMDRPLPTKPDSDSLSQHKAMKPSFAKPSFKPSVDSSSLKKSAATSGSGLLPAWPASMPTYNAPLESSPSDDEEVEALKTQANLVLSSLADNGSGGAASSNLAPSPNQQTQGHAADGSNAVFSREPFGKSLLLSSVHEVVLGADLPQNLNNQIIIGRAIDDGRGGGGLNALERRAFTLVTADPRHADRGGRVTFVAPTASLRDTWVKYLRFLVDRLTVNARLANTNRAFDASNNYAGSSNNSAVLNGIFGPLPSLVPNANDINAASNQSGHLPKESLPPPSMFFFPAKVPGLKAAGIDSAPIPVPAPSTSVIQYSETNDSCSSIANTTSTSPEKGGATDVATGTGNSSEVFNSSVNSSNSGVSYPALLAAAGSLPTSTPRPLPNLKNNPLLKFGSPGFVEDQALKWSVVAAMKRGAFFLKLPNNARGRPHERFVRLSPDVATLRWLSGAAEASQQQRTDPSHFDGGNKTKSSSTSLVPSRAASKSVAQVMSASLGLKRATHVRSVRLAEVAEIRTFVSASASKPAYAAPLSVATNLTMPLRVTSSSSPSSSRDRRYMAQTAAASIDLASADPTLQSNNSGRQVKINLAQSLRRPSLSKEQPQVLDLYSSKSTDLAEINGRSDSTLSTTNSQPLDGAIQITPRRAPAAKHRLSLSRLNPFQRISRVFGRTRASAPPSSPTLTSPSSLSSSTIPDSTISSATLQSSHNFETDNSIQKTIQLTVVEAIPDDTFVGDDEIADLPLPQWTPSIQHKEFNEASLSDHEGNQYEDFESDDDFGIQSVPSPLPLTNLPGGSFDPSESAPKVERGVLRNAGGSNTSGSHTLHPPFFAGSVARPKGSPSPPPPASNYQSATSLTGAASNSSGSEATPKAARRRSFGQFSSFTFSDNSFSATSSPAHALFDDTSRKGTSGGVPNVSSPPTSGGDPELGIVLLDKHKQVLLHLVAPSVAMRDLWCFGLDLVVKHWRPQTTNSIPPPTPRAAAAPPSVCGNVVHGNGPTRRSSHGRFNTSAVSLESIDSPVLPLSPISEAEEGPTPLPAPPPQSRPSNPSADKLAVPLPADSNESNGYSPFGQSADILPEDAVSPRVYDEPGDDFQTEVGHNSGNNDNHGSGASYSGFSAGAFGYDPAAF